MSGSNGGVLVFLLGFFACFGLIFLLAFVNVVRLVIAAKNGGLAAAPKFCPHCGEPTLRSGGIWYPTSPGALFRASTIQLGPIRVGGPMSRAGWTCVTCGGTADKPPASR